VTELRDRVGKILAKVATSKGVADAIIATRDGLTALGELRSAGDDGTVAAMAAAAFAAVETAGLEVGAGPMAHLHASCSGRELLVAGLDDQYILIVVAERGGNALKALEHAQSDLQTALAG